MKKTFSILLVLIILLSNMTTVFADNVEYSKKHVSLIYGGKTFSVNVFADRNEVLYAPIDWMSYFGLYECKETEADYVFYHAGQDINYDFAKRIYISKDGKNYALSYYTDNDGLYKNQLIYQDSDFSKKMLNYLNSNYYGTASYQPILSGSFSNSFFENDTLYLPLAEILPFFNAKVGITENQELYISPNPMSLSQAMYSIDIADLAFNASSDIVGKNVISFTAYILDTFNIADPRLDRFVGTGEENDCKTIFKDYLIDNKAYLSAFDEETCPSPSSSAFELGKDLASFGETGLSAISDANKLDEYVLGMKKSAIQTTSWPETLSSFAKVEELDMVRGAYKMFDYWYYYTNQIDDHRKMLGAVYNYSPVSEPYKTLNVPSYKAAMSIQKQYGEDGSERLLAAADTAMKDMAMDFLEMSAGEIFEYVFLPYKAAYTIAKLIPDFKDAVEQIKNYSLLYVIDDSTKLSTNTYFDMRYSNNYNTEALENLRLCAIHSLVASKHAYVSLWGKDYNHPKVKKIEEALVKLYLTADGVECDSSDYYEKKKAELEKSLKEIKTTDGWSDNDRLTNPAPSNLTYYLGMTVDEIAAIWGGDYRIASIRHGVFVMYYEDNRTPLQFTYISVDQITSFSIIEITIGKEDGSFTLFDNLTNRETYNSLKKMYSNAILEENAFENHIACHLIIDSFSIDYIWTQSNPRSDLADYVSIKKHSVSKPAYLVEYINMTLSDIGSIWGSDYIVATPDFASNCYYRDNRIPFNFDIKRDEIIYALYIDVSQLDGETKNITVDLSGTEKMEALKQKFSNIQTKNFGASGKIISTPYNNVIISYRWESGNWETEGADTIIITAK